MSASREREYIYQLSRKLYETYYRHQLHFNQAGVALPLFEDLNWSDQTRWEDAAREAYYFIPT